MITGVRLTQLAIGEPLLGASWEYKTLKGKDAVVKRLEDIFYNAKYMGFNFIIDTIKPQLDGENKLTLDNNGIYNNIWTFKERIAKYRELCLGLGLQLLIEVDFPTNVTSDNVTEYANFFLDELVSEYDWIKYWQPIVLPDETNVLGQYKCSPTIYKKFMETVYPKIKAYSSLIKVCGPGTFESVSQYVINRDGWLAEAMGEKFGSGSTYSEIGDKGFLPYIDCFSFHGRQDTAGLNYINFPHAMDVIKEGIYTRIGDNNIRFFSTYQGWKANSENEQELKQQGYYELREILNCVKSGVVPFKNQLIDEYPEQSAYGSNFDPSKLDYGLFYWYLGPNAQKPAVDQYIFLIKTLGDYNEITDTATVSEVNDSIDSVTLIKSDSTGDTLATILWPKEFKSETVVLTAAYNRQYLMPNGDLRVIDTSTQITLEQSHFLIVFERVQKLAIDIVDLEKSIERKLNYTEETLTNLVNLLPDSYNKEITDLNFYKLLRSLSIEMADAKVELDMIKEDLYLDYARQESIYNNFGVLVNLKKKADWSWDKYRRLVKGVTQSLLEGPTHKSIVNAIQLFTNFNVSITELYEAAEKMDATVLDGINPQFAFIVEIEKPLEVVENQDDVYTDANYIINIVKPAHTISLIIVTLSGKEDWKEEYLAKHGTEFKDMDSQPGSLSRESGHDIAEGIYGWKHMGYAGQLMTADGAAISNAPLTNGGMFIGPRYVLHDDSYSDGNLGNSDSPSTPIVDAITTLLEADEVELYDKASAAISEFETTAEEFKFGFDTANLIRMNGGPERFRILNKFKLAYATKLMDDVLFEPEYFFDDKFVFKNTLRSFKFNKSMGFGGKFVDPPDKTIVFDFEIPELTFRSKVIRLSDGTESVVNRLKEEITNIDLDMQLIYDTGTMVKENRLVQYDLSFLEDDIMEEDSLVPWIKLNGPSFMEKKLGFKRFKAQYEIETEELETYDSAEDFMSVNPELFPNEFYRPYTLEDEMYHIHKRVTTYINPGQDTVMVEPTDLYLKGKDGEDSLSRVFVNGVIMPGWTYTDIPSLFDNDRANGIRFVDGVVFPGDIVSILYLNDRHIIIGDFPILEDNKFNMEDFPQESYLVYQRTGNTFNLILDGASEVYKGAVDLISSLIEKSVSDKFGKVFDVPEFEGSPNLDHRDFTRKIELVTRLTLNQSFMNQALMVMIPRDIGDIELIPAEFIDIPGRTKDAITEKVADHAFAELKYVVTASVEFAGPEYFEGNIVADLAIIDHPSEIGMMPSEHYVPKDDDMRIVDAAVLIKEDKYQVKEDRPYQDYTTGIYGDIRNRSLTQDNVYSYGPEVYDVRVKTIIDSHVYDGGFLTTDKFIFRDSTPDKPSHDVTFAATTDVFKSWLIKDSTTANYETSDKLIKTIIDTTDTTVWSIANIDIFEKNSIGLYIEAAPSASNDSHTLQSNLYKAFKFCSGSLFNKGKFFTKPVCDYEGYETMSSEEFDKSDIIPAQTEIHNETTEARYIPKIAFLQSEYQKENRDTYSFIRYSDKPSKEWEQENKERYNMKAALCYLELVKYRNGRIPQVLRTISMT